MKNEIDDNVREIRSRTFGYVSTALGLVAGLAWNDAIRVLIESVFPLARNTIAVKFLYAVIVTAVVVLLIRYIEKLTAPKTN